MFSINLSDTHKPGESYKDVLINDVNKPFTQTEIERLAGLKVYDENMVDLSHYIVLTDDEYANNRTKEGIFKQTYTLNLKDYDLDYVLTIYNVDFNKFDLIEVIKIQTKTNRFLDERAILYEVIKELNIKVYKYELKDSNYERDVSVGKYYQTYIITTTNNEKINVLVEVDVSRSKNSLQIIIMGVLILSLAAIITLKVIKRIKGGK